jgi:hypothetical protein
VAVAILVGRFARFGVVGFVATWASATLAMTAMTLDRDARPVADASGVESSSTEVTAGVGESSDTGTGVGYSGTDDSDAGDDGPATITAPSTTTAPTTTGTLSEPEEPAVTPDHLVVPTSTARQVRTEVLTEVAHAADPVTAQPDFTG